MPDKSPIDISVVIPARDEIENLPPLLDEIHAALAGREYEIIVMDDGSTDGSDRMLAERMAQDARLRTVRNERSLGQSASVYMGARLARGRFVMTMDGDGQDDPAFLPAMLVALEGDSDVGLAAGQRVNRRDNWQKRIGSRIANAVRGWMLGDNTRDTGCGLKAFRRDAFLDLPYFETMHRFLPALFLTDGWKIAHVDVVNRPRMHGTSKYGIIDRLMAGLLDLFGVSWIRKRRRRNPMPRLRELER
ncbi:MAG TPA: glycosyltransferase family 2 protein [Rhizobiaceae bacterium]|nr:glycosyltransferase family 2 protein [Rhizobiaceae bacterium]